MVVSLEPRAIMTTGAQTAGDIPITLERSEVPRYFRQFRDATALKKLAHARKGPLYQLIGRKAWYQPPISSHGWSRARAPDPRGRATGARQTRPPPLRPCRRKSSAGRRKRSSTFGHPLGNSPGPR